MADVAAELSLGAPHPHLLGGRGSAQGVVVDIHVAHPLPSLPVRTSGPRAPRPPAARRTSGEIVDLSHEARVDLVSDM